MTTNDLEKTIRNDLLKIEVDLDDLKRTGFICFSETLGIRASGQYAFVKDDKFCFVVVGDKGAVETNEVFENIEDLLYTLYNSIVFSLSSRYELRNRKYGQDFRHVLFERELELFKILGETYYNRGKKEIEEILKRSPYND